MFYKITNQLKNNSPLVIAFLVANVLNFAFNAFLARSLSLSDYGFVALVNTFWTILLVGSGAVMQVTSYNVARAAGNEQKALAAYIMTRNVTRKLAGAMAIIWLLSTPLLAHFFHASSALGVLLFAPMIWLGLLTGAHRGYVQGRLHFSQVGVLFLVEAGAKLILAVAAVTFHLDGLAYLSLPLSVGIAWLVAVIAARRLMPKIAAVARTREVFPWSFLGANLTAGLAAMAFLSVDLILAKHYLSTTEAGHYAVLSLIGKMVYFLGSLLNTFILARLGTAEASGENPRHVYWRIYALTASMVLMGFVALGLLGHVFVPALFGANSYAILPNLIPYCAGIALFTLANISVIYHLAKKHYIFPALPLAGAAIMVVQIILNHSTVAAIAHAVFLAGLLSFVVVTAADLVISSDHGSRKPLRHVSNLFVWRRSAKPAPETMRILVLNWRDTRHTQAGGAELYIHELARRWSKVGHEITLFCGNDGKSPRHEVVNGIKVIRRGSFYVTYFWAFIYYITRFRGQFDVIIDCHNGIPFFTPLYSRGPIYCVVHHVHQDVFTRYLPKPLAAVASFLEATAMPWAYRKCEFLTVSKSSKQNMVEQLGINAKQIQIIPNGVDLERLVPGPKAAAPTVLYVGRLKAYKSVDVLVRAFAKVVEKHPDAWLKIGGAGDDIPRLKSIAAELGIKNRVKFMGRVSEKRKIRLMQEAWVFVNPSYAEGWGITTIEANACGTPVVASNVPGLRDSVKSPSAGYLVRYGDINGFARKILLVLNDEEKRRLLSSNAQDWANNFDWQSSATTFLERIS